MGIEPEVMKIIIKIFTLILLIITRGIFTTVEAAVFIVNKNTIKSLIKEENSKENSIFNIIENKDNFLVTKQIITMIICFVIVDIIYSFEFKIFNGYDLSYIVILLIIVYITLIFGQLLPKRIGIYYREKIAVKLVNIIQLIMVICYPFIKIINFSEMFLTNIFDLKEKSNNDMIIKEEIESIVQTAEDHRTINDSQKEMIKGVFNFDHKTVEKVMRPRTEVYCINIDDPLEEYIDEMLSKRYSRIPIYEGDIDNIIGILYIKDLFIEIKKSGFKNVNVRDLIKKPYFIPECNNVKEVFEDLQSSMRQIAIIIDEYGGFSGIVTIEDLIEEIMGDIEDIYDDRKKRVKKISSNIYLVDGLTTLDEINDILNTKIKSEDVGTLSGYLINLLGKIPEDNENRIIVNNEIIFEIEEVSDKRIEKVKISKVEN